MQYAYAHPEALDTGLKKSWERSRAMEREELETILEKGTLPEHATKLVRATIAAPRYDCELFENARDALVECTTPEQRVEAYGALSRYERFTQLLHND